MFIRNTDKYPSRTCNRANLHKSNKTRKHDHERNQWEPVNSTSLRPSNPLVSNVVNKLPLEQGSIVPVEKKSIVPVEKKPIVPIVPMPAVVSVSVVPKIHAVHVREDDFALTTKKSASKDFKHTPLSTPQPTSFLKTIVGKISKWLPSVFDKSSIPPATDALNIVSDPESVSSAQSVFFSPSDTNVLQLYVGFGLNYSGENQLLTCWNDLQCNYVWWRTNIIRSNTTTKAFILSDNPQGQSQFGGANYSLPTLKQWNAVRSQIVKLAQQQDAQGGSTEIVFYFSGHGFKRRTWDLKELDGQAECIVLSDGLYWDVDMGNEFLKPLPTSTHVFCTFDSCHSGTVTNSRYTYNSISKEPYQTHTNSYQASVWAISGCQDYETSNSGATNRDQSVLTRALFTVDKANILKQIQQTSGATFVDLYNELRITLRLMNEHQIPEFSCSHSNLFRLPLKKN